MATQIPDLWPDLAAEATVTPVAILRAQAANLSTRTNGLLEGRVTTGFEPLGGGRSRLRHAFQIVVPAFGGYTYQLLEVLHDPDAPYPVFICDSEFHISPGTTTVASKTGTTYPDYQEIASEQEFVKYLQGLFSSEKTKRLISVLLAQVRS